MTIARVAVIGAGTMGRGIALAAAEADCLVTLHDARAEQLANPLPGVATATTLADALAGAELVIEAIPESMDAKLALFAALDGAAAPGAILATNTSSLSVSALAAATGRPDRVIGLHFFNPVQRMKLVEVVRGEKTSDATVASALTIVERLGKEAIVVRDSPGFATSRLGLALGLEAMRMVEEGVGTAADIDRAMVLGYNHPVGPLRLTDLVGLDVRLGIAEHLHRSLGDRFRPPEILRRMVEEGRLGRKTGDGFYDWDDTDRERR
jgi:3-hydroxybutyryl-CoA dehydrogenase